MAIDYISVPHPAMVGARSLCAADDELLMVCGPRNIVAVDVTEPLSARVVGVSATPPMVLGDRMRQIVATDDYLWVMSDKRLFAFYNGQTPMLSGTFSHRSFMPPKWMAVVDGATNRLLIPYFLGGVQLVEDGVELSAIASVTPSLGSVAFDSARGIAWCLDRYSNRCAKLVYHEDLNSIIKTDEFELEARAVITSYIAGDNLVAVSGTVVHVYDISTGEPVLAHKVTKAYDASFIMRAGADDDYIVMAKPLIFGGDETDTVFLIPYNSGVEFSTSSYAFLSGMTGRLVLAAVGAGAATYHILNENSEHITNEAGERIVWEPSP